MSRGYYEETGDHDEVAVAEDDGERQSCVGCGETFNVNDSDSEEFCWKCAPEESCAADDPASPHYGLARPERGEC